MKALARTGWLVVLAAILAGCVAPQPAPKTGPAAAPTARKPATNNKEPRPHHYLFAHRLLPSVFFKYTDTLALKLQTEGQAELGRMWAMAGRDLPKEKQLTPEGLNVESVKRGRGTRLLIVTMPETKGMVEAIYAALVIQGAKRLYLTYERSFDLENPSRELAILCSWTPDGAHQNYGIPGSHSRADFEKALDVYFEKNPEPVAGVSPPAK